MKAKLLIEGHEIEVEINESEAQKILEPKKQTGYERLGPNESFYAEDELGICVMLSNTEQSVKDEIFENATYYSDQTVAENNARADKLMRKLRRFAVEHRSAPLTWTRGSGKYSIYYSYMEETLEVDFDDVLKSFGCIYFDSEHTANMAIETFYNELIWYFTEYKDSL